MPSPFNAETAARAREVIEAQREKYREKYLDEDYWTDLAYNVGARLPPFYTRPSDQDIKFWLKLARVSYTQFVDAYGWKDAEQFEVMNPTHGMKIVAGLILELGQENSRIKKLARERAGEFEIARGEAEAPVTKGYRGKSKARRRAELAKAIA